MLNKAKSECKEYVCDESLKSVEIPRVDLHMSDKYSENSVG